MSERYTPEQIDARADALRDNVPFNDTGQQTVGMLRQAAQDARDLAVLRAAAQQLIAALDRKDIWDDDQGPVPIMQAAGEAVGRLRALLPASETSGRTE